MALVALWSGPANDASAALVCGAAATWLAVHTVVSLLTGARTTIVPVRICPVVTGLAALLILLGVMT